MSTFFLAHSFRDSRVVESLARAIETRGFSCWYFERDSQAGEPYLQVEASAIEAAAYVLVLTTSAALDSREVMREIEYAHKRGKKFLPVYRGIDANLVEERNKTWTMAFGTSVHLDLHNGDADACADAIARSLQGMGVARDLNRKLDPPKPTAADATARPDIQWVTDGIQVDPDDLRSFTFTNDTIERFLRGPQLFFLSGYKGLGKTLLLRYKRRLLMEDEERADHSRGNRGVTCIPEDRPFLDQMGELTTLSGGHLELLARLGVCSSLWAFAIRTSAISHLQASASRSEYPRRCKSARIPKWIQGERVSPTVVFRELLSLPPQHFMSLLHDFETAIDYDFRHIHSGMAVFVDKTDHALRKLPRAVWVNVQAGLIDASWECMNANNHVKIYATIREEAFANYQSEVKPNLHGAVAKLRYSFDELQRLMNKLSQFYEHAANFESFAGLRRVTNAQHDIVEDSFRYLYRHTTGRPRDLVIVCSELSQRKDEANEETFRSVVNLASSEDVVAGVFEEMGVFLNCLRTDDARNKFFRTLPYNILTRQEVVRLCGTFYDHTSLGADGDFLNESWPEWMAPAGDLWACGLLGIVQANPVGGGEMQRFRKPNDVFHVEGVTLPDAEFYTIHPSLQRVIQLSRAGDGYHLFKFIIVGDGYPWHRYFRWLVDFQREAFKVKSPEGRELVDAVLHRLHAAMHASSDPRFVADASTIADLEEMEKALDRAGHVDLALRLIDLHGRWNDARDRLA